MKDGSLVPILVALIGALGLVLVALIPLLVSTRRHAKGANEAVNQKHPSEPRIADVVDQIAADVREQRHDLADLANIVGEHIAEHRG